MSDIPALALMTEAVHTHGALAGIELAYNGIDAVNLYSRVPPLAPRSMGVVGGSGYDPVQTRRMDKEDIRAMCAGGTARRRCGQSAQDSTSSIVTPVMG
jgi:dimethylamine/trimethylamine dehydrogenase